MGYSDFTMDSLRHAFSLTVRDQALFSPVGDLMPSPWLRESLRRGSGIYTVTEKARSEFVVAPILTECCEAMERRVNVFSGVALNVDPPKGLAGECDFILAHTLSKFDMQSPLMLILEAKKHDVDFGLPQCAAQMLAACKYNEREKKQLPYLYGCVTNVNVWHFLKLEGQELQLHPERFGMDEVSKILWLLVECLKDIEHRASEAA